MEEYSKVNANDYAQMPICDRVLSTELSGDMTLPDYQPEIKRLLKISASVLPPSKYIGDSQAEFAGNIDYYVFYTGSDNEIYCAPLTGEYKIEVPIEQDAAKGVSNLTGSIDIVPDMISGRVISPRKLNVKCRLKSQARIFGEAYTGRGVDDGDNEVLCGVAPITRTLFGAADMHRLSDEMIIDQRDGEVRVISASGRALICEISCADGVVNCRGDVYLKMLMTRESGGQPYTTQRKLPFSQVVNVEGAEGRCQATAKATVCEMNIEVEDNRILIDVGLITDVTVRKSERVRYVKDVYSTVYKTECQYKPMKLYTKGTSFNTNFTFSDSESLEDAGIATECHVLDSSGIATLDSVGFDDNGRMTINGKIKFTLLMDKNGEYLCSDVEMPFKYSAEVGVQGENIINTICPTVISSRARIDGERVGIDAEISLCGGFAETMEISMLDGVSFGDEITRSNGELVLCYPSASDSLWSVAKRYGAAVSELVKNNRISNDTPYDAKESLEGINYLFV